MDKITKEEWELVVLALCEFSNAQELCTPEQFHKLQPVIKTIMKATKVAWPYK
jgi:hypothetical protein